MKTAKKIVEEGIGHFFVGAQANTGRFEVSEMCCHLWEISVVGISYWRWTADDFL